MRQVYSVGIADNWQFDEAMGRLGCEVHSFDPTVDLPSELAQRVTFHKMGFAYAGIGETKLADAYNAVDGPLLSLEQVADRLGHRGRRLDVLKIDCEGCEWGIIQELGRPHPPLTGPDNLVLEIHLSKEYGIRSMQDVESVAQLFRYLFEPTSGQPFQRFHYHENVGFSTHRSIFQPLAAAGMKHGSCCRELGFMRQPNATSSHRHPRAHCPGPRCRSTRPLAAVASA